jgi:hypothetical protein
MDPAARGIGEDLAAAKKKSAGLARGFAGVWSGREVEGEVRIGLPTAGKIWGLGFRLLRRRLRWPRLGAGARHI